MIGNEFDRRDSRKRRRVSQRKVLSHMGLDRSSLADSPSRDDRWSSLSQPLLVASAGSQSAGARSQSPLTDRSQNISMKIQFHITVAPDDEPLILDTTGPSSLYQLQASSNLQTLTRKRSSSGSIGDHIHERLTRQASPKRRQQLISMHNQTALGGSQSGAPTGGSRASLRRLAGALSEGSEAPEMERAATNQSEDNLSCRPPRAEQGAAGAPAVASAAPVGREQGARSFTITSGMADEATVRFLARQEPRASLAPAASPSPGSLEVGGGPREHIYFKRDGQRFGHEFTLKLAVDKTYRCLLKLRPLLPLQTISVQGHQVLFVDCSSRAGSASLNTSAASSPTHQSLQNIHHSSSQQQSGARSAPGKFPAQAAQRHHRGSLASSLAAAQSARPAHQARASASCLGGAHANDLQLGQLVQQQMLRHFAPSHCSSSSNSHLGSQLIYMFDWPAGQFEVNKNKNRTQVQLVLHFHNGQILSLPLQVKFYQPECRQHLAWGSQLHFIDYDCSINTLGQVNVDRVQYY